MTVLHLISNHHNSLHSNSLFTKKIKTTRRAFFKVPLSYPATLYLCFPLFYLPLCYGWTVPMPKTSLSNPLDPIPFHILKHMTPTTHPLFPLTSPPKLGIPILNSINMLYYSPSKTKPWWFQTLSSSPHVPASFFSTALKGKPLRPDCFQFLFSHSLSLFF